MKRQAIRILLGLWLLLCLVIALVWIGSRVHESGRFGDLDYWADSQITGKISITLHHYYATPIVGPQLVANHTLEQLGALGRPTSFNSLSPMEFSPGVIGFFVGSEKIIDINSGKYVVFVGRTVYLSVPHWFGVIMWLPFPVVLYGWWQRRKRLGRAKRGLCVNCGYDLRATPLRCPECGMAAERIDVTGDGVTAARLGQGAES